MIGITEKEAAEKLKANGANVLEDKKKLILRKFL